MSKKLLRPAVMAAFLAGSVFSTAALAVYEAEPNDSPSSAQQLTISGDGTAEVTGAIGDPSGTTLVNDVDFYTFQGHAGDLVTIDIDGGSKVAGTGRSVDTILTLFAPDMTVAAEDDDAPAPDDGSDDTLRDALISAFRLPVDGTYTIAVSAYNMGFNDGAVLERSTAAARSNGSYTLLVSGVTPPPVQQVQQINIEIRPGERHRVSHRHLSKGRIAVALLGSDKFDALQVSAASLTFGPTGKEVGSPRCHERGWDVNHDGYKDLVCHFDVAAAGFEFADGDLTAMVKGTTKTGILFEGQGRLKVHITKRHRHRHDRDGDRDRDDDR